MITLAFVGRTISRTCKKHIKRYDQFILSDDKMNTLIQIDDFRVEKVELQKTSIDFRTKPQEPAAKICPPLVCYKQTPSSLRISTMTILTSISSRVDLELLYLNVRVFPVGYIMNVRFFNRPIRGLFRVKHIKVPKKNQQMFLNQITFDIKLSSTRVVSAKLFRDGKVQLAGCVSIDEAKVTMERLTEAIARCKNITVPGTMSVICSDEDFARLLQQHMTMEDDACRDTLFEYRRRKLTKDQKVECTAREIPMIRKSIEAEDLCVQPLEIVMINSDFDSKVHIDKDKMVSTLKRDYSLHCRPSSSRYPGINAKFVSSIDCRHGCADGRTKKTCADMSKRGSRKDGCVTVSILAFTQGKVIITGARSVAQLEDTYKFITNVFAEKVQDFGRLS